ncbi:MAG TPA: ABC transporter ATP-binding protein [Caulobacteraceae bacterium]|jgi:ABC-type iron transport system FetAB ATPase subunit
MTDDSAASQSGLLVRRLKSDLAGPFDFAVEPGGCAVISGPSGSGKSLFLRMIADLDPSAGEVRLNGTERSTMTGPAWRRMLPYVPSEAGWWLDGVIDHFAPAARDEARRLAADFGLVEGQFEAEVARLSTGERQRLAIIRALVLRSPALLLDEPTSALDTEDAMRVEAALQARLAQGCVIVMISHDAGQAARLKAAAYRMVERKLERAGLPEARA